MLNPERFTGYAGDSAHNVWRAIYEENCFGLSEAAMDASTAGTMSSSSAVNALKGAGAGGFGFSKLSEGWGTEMIKGAGRSARDDVCEEKRIYYRVISGMRTSVHRCQSGC
jgi:ERO1-like protein alpha